MHSQRNMPPLSFITYGLLHILLQRHDAVCQNGAAAIHFHQAHFKEYSHNSGPRNLTGPRKSEIGVNSAIRPAHHQQQHIKATTSALDSASSRISAFSQRGNKYANWNEELSNPAKLRRQFKRGISDANTTIHPFPGGEEFKQGRHSINQSGGPIMTVNLPGQKILNPDQEGSMNSYSLEQPKGDEDSPDNLKGFSSNTDHMIMQHATEKPLTDVRDKRTTEQHKPPPLNGGLEFSSKINDLDPRYYDVVELQRRNVSHLLDFLMNGYDKRLRPGFGGKPVVVKTDIVIRSMGPISERDMIYSMDCYFRQKWKDDRLSFNASQEQVDNVTLNVKMLDRIWKPDTIFFNGGHSYIHTITVPNMFFRLSHDGSILYSQRLTIKANCPMHLEKFPMDTQQCPLHIGSFGYSDHDVHYEWHYGNEKAAKAANDMRMSQFDLKGMPACNMTRYLKGTQHSVLIVYFDFRRHTGFFLIQVYLPCSLLVVLSWVSFWINREATSERISLGATTMLTLTLLVLDTRNDLPRVAYPTALDIYVAMCFSFIFASIVQFAAVHFYTKYGTADEDMRPFLDTDEEDEDDDDSAFDMPGPTDLNRNRSSTNSMTACLEKMWRCIKSTHTNKKRFNKNVRSSLGLNSVSKIDKVSRIIFPAAFSGFNIVYWMSYL